MRDNTRGNFVPMKPKCFIGILFYKLRWACHLVFVDKKRAKAHIKDMRKENGVVHGFHKFMYDCKE